MDTSFEEPRWTLKKEGSALLTFPDYRNPEMSNCLTLKKRNSRMLNELMVGAIGFECTRPQSFQSLAGLGWQPKDRNGSQWNNYWTWIGHSNSIQTVGQQTPAIRITAIDSERSLLGRLLAHGSESSRLARRESS